MTAAESGHPASTISQQLVLLEILGSSNETTLKVGIHDGRALPFLHHSLNARLA